MNGLTHPGSALGERMLPPTLKAIVLDVDGTLYDQRSLRRAMAVKLLRHAVCAPLRNWRTVHVLRVYRQMQEQLRAYEGGGVDLATTQIERVAAHTGMEPEDVRQIVRRWMELEPLPLLAARARAGLGPLIAGARARGIRLGVLSDYPCRHKLEALGLAHSVDVVVCAQDPTVQRFKPDPRGLLAVFQQLGVPPDEGIYVGDRPDVDAVAAHRAGARSVIVAGRPLPGTVPFVVITDFSHLAALLFGAPSCTAA
jgi:FMN phosphatase YigB (HAD superfamily)